MSANITPFTIYFFVAFDLSEFSDLDLIFIKPDGDLLDVTPILGTADITVSNRNLAANEYVAHTFEIGEIDQAGDWSVYLSYDEVAKPPRPARYLISPLETLTVQEVVI